MKRLLTVAALSLATLGLMAASPRPPRVPCAAPTPAVAPSWFPPTRGQPVLISLQRTACFGRCPIYRVEIRGDGLVTYRGERFVAVTGTRTRRISPAAVQGLLDRFRAVGYFGLRDSYRGGVTDMPSAITALRVGRYNKRVVDYAGEMAGMPPAVSDLEAAIDRVAGTAAWVGR